MVHTVITEYQGPEIPHKLSFQRITEHGLSIKACTVLHISCPLLRSLHANPISNMQQLSTVRCDAMRSGHACKGPYPAFVAGTSGSNGPDNQERMPSS